MVIETIVNPAAATPTSAFLEVALKELNRRSPGYKKFCDYYDGEQPLTFATDKFRDTFSRMVAAYTENMCPTVVDTIADRLIITGFEVRGQAQDGTTGDNADRSLAWDIWENNRLDVGSGEVHQEAVKNGDAYVLVWPNDAGEVEIVPQRATSMLAHYDPDSGKMDWAAKWWMEDDNRARLNIYLADVVERWITRGVVRSGSSVPPRASSWTLMPDAATIPNPYGEVPVFHFANNAKTGGHYGQSDLKNVIPIQDALNKAVADMLVTMEFAAFPQRWATGMQQVLGDDGKPIAPFEAGVSRLWTANDVDTKFGEFGTANLDQMLHVQEKFLLAMARVSGVPTHYMLINPSAFPSGESLKTAEARFVSKVADRQLVFGNTWEDVLTFALKVSGRALPGRLSAMWKDASPRSDLDMATVATLKKGVGVSDRQNQRELGYTEEQINDMAAESAADTANALANAQSAFARGAGTNGGGFGA